MGEVGVSKRRPEVRPGDLAAAFEALIALSDARWDLSEMKPNDPGREECWDVMLNESGKLLQASVLIASALLGEEGYRLSARLACGGAGR